MSSGMIDDDTREIVEGGRETLGEFLVTLRNEFRKVFVVFAVGMVGTVVAMQYYVWEILRGVTEARMSEQISQQYDILVRSPFDVILLQVKIGLVVGAIIAIPVLLYYSREGLQRRGIWPDLQVARWKAAAVGLLSLGLFAAGGAYAYYVFFPVMFDFLTTYTLNVGFTPNYDIVMWTEFIILLTASFGLAGQLPLVMSALAYLEIIPYETFRDKWRYAVLGIFVFGAFFSPPDPFTQIMWAVPLLVLYGVSLYFAKFVTAVRRGGSAEVLGTLRANWNRVAGAYVLSSATVYFFVERGYVQQINAILREAPPDFRYEIVLQGLPLSGSRLALALALAWGAVVTFPLLVYYAWPELEPRGRQGSAFDFDEMSAAAVEAAPASVFADMDEPEALSHAQRAMDADDPEKARAILSRYDEVSEDDESEGQRADASAAAGEPTDAERPDNMAEDAARPDNVAEDAARPDNMAEDAARESRTASDMAQERAAGMVDAFTEEETTDDDIGGYYYDLRFILESLTSKVFRIMAVFMATVAIVFFALYRGGIGAIKRDFLSRLPQEVVDEGVDIVALHPVEAILFEVKMSVIAGLVTTLPILLYYAWPAIEERLHGITREFETEPPLAAIAGHWNQLAGAFVLGAGATYYALTKELVAVPDSLEVAGRAGSGTELGWAAVAAAGLGTAVLVGTYHAGASIRERIDRGGKQNVFLLWLFTLTGGVIAGSALGYAYIAPGIISYLVEDAIRAEMIIAYRINNFFWLIFATTVGIGLLADVPLTMWLFHRGDVVPFETMRERWREVVVAIFGISALATPSSLLSMFLMAFPVAVAYLIGLGGLWLLTLPWRVRDRVGRLVGGG